MRYITSIVFSLLFFILFSTSSVFAQNNYSSEVKVPQPKGTVQVEITNARFEKGTLSADLQIKNDTENDLLDIMYGFQIISPSKTTTAGGVSVTSPGWLVGYKDYDFFSLKKGEVVIKKITYKIGNNWENGNYSLLIQIQGKDAGVIGYQTQTFSVKGSGKYLMLDPNRCLLRIGETSYALSDGPIISNDQGIVSCELTNPTQESIDVNSMLDYAIWAVSFYPSSKEAQMSFPQKISLKPGETKTITLTIPSVQLPQVYQGLWYFVDKEGNKMTPLVGFRWTVSGASSTILGVNPDKRIYKNGEKAIVSVIVEPSADLAWSELRNDIGTDLDNAVLRVNLIGSNNMSCGSKEITLPKTSTQRIWGTPRVSVEVIKDCPSFTVKTEVLNNNKILASVEKRYGNGSQKENDTSSQKNLPTWIFIGIGIITLVVIGLFIYKKKKRLLSSDKTTNLTILLFLLLTFFFVQKASAGIKQPVDSPIESKTVMGATTWWANASNFSSNSPTGRSSFSVNANCSVGSLYIYGYANHAFCNNYRPGIHTQVFIDGQQVTLTGIQSPDSTPTTASNCIKFPDDRWGARSDGGYGCPRAINEFFLDSPSNGGGLRTGTATIAIPSSMQTGQHTVEVRVGAAGRHYSSGGGYFIHSSIGGDYIKLTTTYSCGVNRCNQACTTPADCADARDGCTACISNGSGGKTCQPPPTPTPTPVLTCGKSCTQASECALGVDGCRYCLPTATGARVCSPARACNQPCERPDDCQSAQGCGSCLADGSGRKTCQPPPACGSSCTDDTKCTGAPNGCTSCVPNNAGEKICAPAPKCGDSCLRDDQCAGAKDGCTTCGESDTSSAKVCRPPAACGVACSKDSQCAGARDGCTFCTAGKCSAFNPDMCSCDGMDFLVGGRQAVMLPGDKVTFIAYGKVPGKDWKGSASSAITAAEITSMQFSLYQSKLSNPNDSIRIAQSAAITPQIVETTSTNVRYKVTWDRQLPATVPPGTLFRIQATLKCSPKAGVLGAYTLGENNYFTQLFDSVSSLFTKGSVLAVTDIPQKRDEQQAKTFSVGANIQEKTCTFIKFYFE